MNIQPIGNNNGPLVYQSPAAAPPSPQLEPAYHKITQAVDSYLTNVSQVAENPHTASLSKRKELLEKLSSGVEKAISLTDSSSANLLLNTASITKLSTQVSKNIKNVVSGIKFTDEALVASALIVQSIVIMRVNQSLKEHESLHQELSELILQYPTDLDLQNRLAELDLVISHLRSTSHQASELSLHNWTQLISASGEQSIEVLMDYLPSLQSLQTTSGFTSLFADLVVVAYAGHALHSNHTKDLQLANRQQELDNLILKESDPILQNYLKMELSVVNRAIEETGLEMLRNCTVLSVSLSLGAILATQAGLLTAGIVTSPITLPLSIFASIVTVGVLGYQFRHEINYYTKLGHLYLSNFNTISKHQKAVEAWEIEQSKTEIALNTSDLVKKIALEIADCSQAILNKKHKLQDKMNSTQNPIKKAYLSLQLFMLTQEELVLTNEKNRRIQNVLNHYEEYRRQLPEISSSIDKLEASIISSSDSLKGYSEEKLQLMNEVKKAKLGISSTTHDTNAALETQYGNLRNLKEMITAKKKTYNREKHTLEEKQDMNQFFNKEIAQLNFEMKSIHQVIKDGKSIKKVQAEQNVTSNYNHMKIEDMVGGTTFEQRIEVILHQIKRSPQAKEKILQYLESRILAANSGLKQDVVKQYLRQRLDENPKQFLTLMALQQHQHRYYSEVLATQEIINDTFRSAQDYKEGEYLAQPKATEYLQSNENKSRIIMFITCMLTQEGVDWTVNPTKMHEFEVSLKDILYSGDPLQQEALLRRHQLIDKYNRFTPQILQLLIPPASLEKQTQDRINAIQTDSTISPNYAIDLAIFSLGVIQ